MKTLVTLVIGLAGITTSLYAQTPDPGNREKMLTFAAWQGKWKGEGSIQMGPGEPKKSTVEEKIESKLDGTILYIEGVGKAEDAATKQQTVVHHAIGILWYDPMTSQYKLRSWLKDGRSTDAWINITGENQFQWGFDVPNYGKTRYSIKLDPAKKTWNEIGEFSRDGNTWSKFFEMNLKKVE